MHLEKYLCDKKNGILMSDGKNVSKLPGDHIDFNLNLKIILSHLFDTQQSIYTKKKKKVPKTFDSLVSFVPSDISVQHEIQGDKRIGIMS